MNKETTTIIPAILVEFIFQPFFGLSVSTYYITDRAILVEIQNLRRRQCIKYNFDSIHEHEIMQERIQSQDGIGFVVGTIRDWYLSLLSVLTSNRYHPEFGAG